MKKKSAQSGRCEMYRPRSNDQGGVLWPRVMLLPSFHVYPIPGPEKVSEAKEIPRGVVQVSRFFRCYLLFK